MKFKKTLLYSLLMMAFISVNAQTQEAKTEYVFAPHWYIQAQGGAQYTLGEVDFSDLISPNAQIEIGWQFNPVLGARIGTNMWQSKGGSRIEGTEYMWKWHYNAPALDLTVDLSNLIGGFNPKRVVSFGIFGGVGANIAMNNDEAAAANAAIKATHAYAATYEPLRYLWNDKQIGVVGRFGANIDFRLCDAVSAGIELQANTLSDRYNSKKARNTDWYFNALAGIKINLGKGYTEQPIVLPEPEVRYVEKVVEKIVEKPVTVEKIVREPLRRDIFFTINSTVVTKAESLKVQDIADYLAKYPDAKVTITGYADAGTGNAKINERLAAKRAEAVTKLLTEKYNIAASRISYDSKGDRVQPFTVNDQNRVSICIAE